ncbi:hypothetical protein GCM10010358_79540 [Streptomyces minutiscleroticus]|uniref:Uncharacterized protein n=1 Tax=Streptomyces minutiscleroticus TaxID=68238 RepID=A0A918P2W7_9ACTN|nr:hypothetical protein GCM10010358_79540 [Streptomyces minutiscleroticus]
MSLQVVEWLAPRALAQVVRIAYDPEAQLMLATRNAAARAPAPTSPLVTSLSAMPPPATPPRCRAGRCRTPR